MFGLIKKAPIRARISCLFSETCAMFHRLVFSFRNLQLLECSL